MGDLRAEDLKEIIIAHANENTLVGHHIRSFDSFSNVGIAQIIVQLFKIDRKIHNIRNDTPEDKLISEIQYSVEFTGVNLKKPTYNNNAKIGPLWPNLARTMNINYSSEIRVDAKVTAIAYYHDGKEKKREAVVENVFLTNIPVMVNSVQCHLNGIPEKGRMEAQEDPTDVGGYFIIKGREWAIDMIETRVFNMPHIFRNVGHRDEVTRLEFLSKPGDGYENSTETQIIYRVSGDIHIIIQGSQYLNIPIPFHIVFKILGMITDEEMFKCICYGFDDEIGKYMFNVLYRACNKKDPIFTQARGIASIPDLVRYFNQTAIEYKLSLCKTTEESDKIRQLAPQMEKNIHRIFDRNLLPHMGTSPEDRHIKLRYLGHLIHKTLLVEMEVVPSTDRDALRNKRIFAAGRAYARIFKTCFNKEVIKKLQMQLNRAFMNHSFSDVRLEDVFRNSINPTSMEESVAKPISSDTGIKMSETSSVKLTSEAVHQKNQLNRLSTLRVVRVSSVSKNKADPRADFVRRVKSSFIRYICPAQSADTGEHVGLVKQLALGCGVEEAGNSLLLAQHIKKDPELLHLQDIFNEDIYSRRLTKVFVNGVWIGCVEKPWNFVARYREARRGWNFIGYKKVHGIEVPEYKHVGVATINPSTTIHWDSYSNEIQFWVDVGRLSAPFIVVRNNTEFDSIGTALIGHGYNPFKGTGFQQISMFTHEHAQALKAGKITIGNLVEMGVIDLLAPDEVEGVYLCPNLDEFIANATNHLRRYTHLDIPEGLLGAPASVCPYANHNGPSRVTFETNQVKQTCGWPFLNYPFRIDKHVFWQFYVESPLVRTITNDIGIHPLGMNTMVAIACYGGYNQEDSLIYNTTAASRGMYNLVHFNKIHCTLEKGEIFGVSNKNITAGIKLSANYGKLDKNGFIRPGPVEKGDVVIAKYIPLNPPEQDKKYKDTSIVYDSTEPGRVHYVVTGTDQDKKQFASVKITNFRALGVGNKFSSRAGHKGVTSKGYAVHDLFYTENGLVPDIIMNPSGIPSRMTIGQMIEGAMAKICAVKGHVVDGTVFKNISTEQLGDTLRSLGYDPMGRERIYNGFTGEWMDVTVFFCPAFYQMLQKFAIDEIYAISHGSTCAITHQPLDGKGNNGGIRIGEMERDTLLVHGNPRYLTSKYRDDSDGTTLYVCGTCGRTAVHKKLPIEGVITEVNICRTCEERGDIPDIYAIESSHASRAFIQEAESCNVGIKLSINKPIYDC